ncbi:MAG: TerB family tellurite resistance protein [Bacteroidota bacterium]
MPLPTPLSPERLRDLVLLYLAVGYGGDDSLATAEHDAIVELAQKWAPGQGRYDTEAIVDTAAVATRSGLGPTIDEIVRALRPALLPGHRQRVLSDLAHVARADGVLTIAEASMIRRIRSAWGHA